MSAPGSGTRCAGHPWLTGETRQLAEQLLDHVEPWVRRLREDRSADTPDPTPVACTWCPLCALAATLRGERPELAVRLAEHASGLLAAAREALAQHDPEPHGPDRPASEAGDQGRARPTERVQRIVVRRPGPTPPDAAGPDGC